MDKNYKLFSFMQLTKNGTQFLTGFVSIPVTYITSIREVLIGSEMYMDGAISYVGTINADIVSTEPFMELINRYNELIKEIE